MNLIDPHGSDCVPIDQRLQRLPRKQLKFWVENFPFNPSSANYCNIHIKYGSVLCPTDGLTETVYAGWVATCRISLTANSRYTGYAINSYNAYASQILTLFGATIQLNNVSKLNYLLTNVPNYISQGMSVSDIQVSIWGLMNAHTNTCFPIDFDIWNVVTIINDVQRFGRHFVPTHNSDVVAVFLVAANNWPSTSITFQNQVFILPLTYSQFHPACTACSQIEWGNYLNHTQCPAPLSNNIVVRTVPVDAKTAAAETEKIISRIIAASKDAGNKKKQINTKWKK